VKKADAAAYKSLAVNIFKGHPVGVALSCSRGSRRIKGEQTAVSDGGSAIHRPPLARNGLERNCGPSWRVKIGAAHSYAEYNWRMSESIESRDPIFILQRALGHLKDQGKNVSNDDDVFELLMHAIRVFRDPARLLTQC
jgi:hypothetical protein